MTLCVSSAPFKRSIKPTPKEFATRLAPFSYNLRVCHDTVPWLVSLVRQKTMSRFESVTIREVESSDLETFYEHRLDPEAIRMAALSVKTQRTK